MAINNHYKKQTTPQEREECYQWFEQNMDSLPKHLELGFMSIDNVPGTAKRFIKKMRNQKEGASIFEGQFAILQMIREFAEKKMKEQ
jgi:hypothetical protein